MAAPLLPALLDDLLAAAVLALTADGSGVEGPPERQYVSHGAPALDCAQVTAHLSALRFEQAQANPCYAQPVYALVVTLIRCVPTVDGQGAPTAAELDASALALAHDGQALADLSNDCDAVFPTARIRCDSVRWTPGLAPIAPQGGLGGWTFGLEVRP